MESPELSLQLLKKQQGGNMLKLTHSTLVFLSGLVWFAIGAFLLQIGLNLLFDTTLQATGYHPVVAGLTPYFGSKEQVVLLIITLALLIGYFKGRFALGKAVQRGVSRIVTFPNPTSIANIYSGKYYLLIGVMILLGASMKFFNVPKDIRGGIDVTVGAALINGAIIYFRTAYNMKRAANNLL